jgi:hypothetical protein
MRVVERSIRLAGQAGLGLKPRPEFIGPVLGNLHATLQDAVRMGFLHSSRARGRVPRSVQAAADVRFIGHVASSDEETLLRFEVSPFCEAAAELFAQGDMWEEGPKPEQTAFEVLGGVLIDVQRRQADSDRFDAGMLQRIASYGTFFRRTQVNSMVLADVALEQTACLNLEVAQSARSLAAETPAPRRIRLVGRLDVIGISQSLMKLRMGRGAPIAARWEGREELATLSRFLDRDVLCEGTGVFRPSGSLLRIDVDAVEAATESADAFRHVPSAQPKSSVERLLAAGRGVKLPYTEFLGAIPGEEPDDEFAAEVARLS